MINQTYLRIYIVMVGL